MRKAQDLRPQRNEGDNPLGMSTFSIRRYSMQYFILILLVNLLLVALTESSTLWGNAVLVALSATTMVAVWIKTALVVWVGLRTVEVEIWIRRLGMGDFECRIEPQGSDEIAMACQSLETLRLRSIEVVRLQLMERLSADLEVARAHGGGGEISSTPGKGSTVTLNVLLQPVLTETQGSVAEDGVVAGG